MKTVIHIFTIMFFLLGTSCSKNHDLRADLLAAIDERDLSAVKRLAESGCDISSPDKWGNHFTPLMWAILYDEKDIATYLIAKGCDVNQQDIDGETALQYALYGGDANIDLVKQLIKHGADVNHRDKKGIIILSDAKVILSDGKPLLPESKIISILIENGAHD